MNPRETPVGQELFRQWARARGRSGRVAARDFIRRWEHVEEAAELHGTPESETLRDLRDLAAEGWVRLESPRAYPHRIAKIRIPADAETRWKDAFGFVAPDDTERRKIEEFDWSPPLAFVAKARVNVSFDTLVRIDRFFREPAGANRRSIPIKERSLQIFGDEKRLDELFRGSVLFGEGRLTLDGLACFIVPEPLPWSRGLCASGPVIVLENAATWESYRQWDRCSPRFSAIVYGGGDRFREGVGYLKEVFEEIGGERTVVYFGDLDAAGLRIPRTADDKARASGLPPILPHRWSYRQLFDLPERQELRKADGCQPPLPADLEWLGDMAEEARTLMSRYGRLAQEWVNLDLLLG